MTPDQSAENEFAAESLGQRFRQAREAKGLNVDEAAARMRVPTSVIEALERDDLQRLGAAIYVRGHTSSYARLLGVPMAAVEQVAGQKLSVPPPLVAMAPSTRMQRMADRLARRAVYIVLTGAIVLPVVWYATSEAPVAQRVSLNPLDMPQAPAPSVASEIVLAPAPEADVTVAAPDYPVVASIASFYSKASPADRALETPAATREVDSNRISLSFSAASWVEIYDTQGRSIEQALVPAGSERHYDAAQVSRFTLGNAEAVEVRLDGKAIDISPYRRANVARFTVSSDGTLTPAGG